MPLAVMSLGQNGLGTVRPFSQPIFSPRSNLIWCQDFLVSSIFSVPRQETQNNEVFGLFSLHHVYPKICTAVKLYEMREIQLPVINHEARSNILGLLPSSVDRSHLRTTRILASQSWIEEIQQRRDFSQPWNLYQRPGCLHCPEWKRPCQWQPHGNAHYDLRVQRRLRQECYWSVQLWTRLEMILTVLAVMPWVPPRQCDPPS